jgi:hypothetical protein
VAARLRGTNAKAVAKTGLDGSWAEIEDRFNTKIGWGKSIDDAYGAAKSAGDGAMAIVGIKYSNNAGSHVVIIANDHGKVGIVEGQNWKPGQNAGVIYDAKAANLRYNSDGKSEIGVGVIPRDK